MLGIGRAIATPVGRQPSNAKPEARLPKRAAVRAKFLVHSPDGQLLAAFSSHKTCSIGHVDRDIGELVKVFVDKITYCEREQKYSLFYDSPQTESAARMLAGVGRAAFIMPEDVRSARELLRVRLDQQPDDHCAMYLMGVLHELLGDKSKARDYYNKAITLCPLKGYSEGLARIAALEQQVRMGKAERLRVQKQLNRARAREIEQRQAEGKDYKDLIKDQ